MSKAVIYYLTLPILYFLAALPFWLLYRLSDVLFILVYHGLGYRKKVVFKNLENAFPEKSAAEIEAIAKKFYQYFCDLVLETLKTLLVSPSQMKKRVSFEGVDVFKKYYEEKRSVIIVMGHWGNWEYAGARFSLEPIHQLYVIYHPLSNKYFDRLLYHMRTRLGTKLYPMRTAAKGMISNRKQITATAFIADQTPPPENAYWTTFLNQETPIFTGVGKLAKKLNYPVIYAGVERVKRGYYAIYSELLFDQPADFSEDEINEAHTRQLEQDIVAQPECWLWTHRRWKHKKPETGNG